MVRSLTHVKTLSALLTDGFSTSITRRGYAATAEEVASSSTRGGGGAMSGKVGKKAAGEEKTEVSWVPDPVTGYYKPENSKEIDMAELRAALLNKKN